MLVSGWQQAITLVAVLVPGFVFQGVERRRLGPSPEDRELTVRLLRALVVSVGFLLLYLIALGGSITDRLTHADHRFDDPRVVGIAGSVLVFVLPALAGHVSASFKTRMRQNRTSIWATLVSKADAASDQLTWRRALFSGDSDYSPIPTAWDFATNEIPSGSFIRVLLPDGTWLGGQATDDSFFTGYPEPRDIYIDRAWQLDADGVFEEELPGPTGVWIPCVEALMLQVVPPDPDNGEEVD